MGEDKGRGGGQENSGAEKDWRNTATTATTRWHVSACDTVM